MANYIQYKVSGNEKMSALPDSPLDLELLLLCACDRKPICGIIRLDKMLFLLHDSNAFPKCFEYLKHGKLPRYGPFIESLLDDLQALEEEGIIRYHDLEHLMLGYRIELTDFGSRLIGSYQLTSEQVRVIRLIKILTNDFPLNDLVGLTYEKA